MGHDRTHLCPRCAAELIKNTVKCKKCGVEFKNKKKARMLSIFLPGGGYFYVRQYVLGVINVLTELALIGAISWMSYMAWTTWNASQQLDQKMLFFIGASLAGLAYIKIASIFHSIHFIEEFIPVAKKIDPIKK